MTGPGRIAENSPVKAPRRAQLKNSHPSCDRTAEPAGNRGHGLGDMGQGDGERQCENGKIREENGMDRE